MIPASVGFQCPECVREGQASIRLARRGSGLRMAGRRWGAVTLSLIAANVAMFLVTAVSAVAAGHSPLDNSLSPVFDALSQWPYGVNLFGQWWRVFTAAFLHIGPIHLAVNMLALLLFGSELERQLGRWRYLSLYLLSALGGAAAIQLLGDPRVPVAGASAAIYGLLGALGVFMLAQRHGATYVDLWPVFADAAGAIRKELTKDNLHLSTAGYLAWADVLRPHLRRFERS